MTTFTLQQSRRSAKNFLLPALFAILVFSSCNKPVEFNNSPRPFSYSSEVLDKWMTLQLRLMRNATGIANQAFSRHVAYAGVAALESLKPGLPGQTRWYDKLNGLTGLPESGQVNDYYFPANVNAALAAINKSFFPNASVADKNAIDSLEAALNQSFLSSQPQSVITTSSNFGKAVAAAVYNWAETDGYKNANLPYTIPVGTGLWKPTPPAYANPSTPYWGNNRTIIKNSTVNTDPGALPTYSTNPNSAFYQMVKEVYDVSLTLTTDQKAMAIFWRDVPGATSPGHWLSILQQVMRQQTTSLDKGALAYALTGIAMNDALISCFKTKYKYNVVRPVTYIWEVMGHTSWGSFIGTPPHPEYSSAHSSLSGAAAAVLENLFGNIGSFTDHTYDYMGLPARTYSSMTAIGEEAGQSRLFAGIHYQPSIDAGLEMGRKVVANMFDQNYSK